MTSESIRSSVVDVERRLAQLRAELESGSVVHTPALDQATEDLGVSLEELHVALEELETTNEELAVAKLFAEQESRRYGELFQLAPAACFVTDTRGVMQEANRAAASLLGRRAAQLIGKPLSTFIASADYPRFFRFLDGILASPGPPVPEREFRILCGGGELLATGVTAAPIRDTQGHELGARWLVRDLSAQHRAERERREAGDRAAYRHIAGGVIHHLNNLLGSIRGYSELLVRAPETGERSKRAANQIHAATERGERLTNQLLAFTKDGRRQTEAQSINAIVQEACRMVSEMLPEGTEVRADLSAELAAARVDPVDLCQAVLNLIFNACDALEHGGVIDVETLVTQLDKDAAGRLDLESGCYVGVVVRDAGRGMDLETRAHAFEPFFSTKAIGSGFGLGLPTAEAIAREAQGAIELESEPGRGTAVTLYLPRVHDAQGSA